MERRRQRRGSPRDPTMLKSDQTRRQDASTLAVAKDWIELQHTGGMHGSLGVAEMTLQEHEATTATWLVCYVSRGKRRRCASLQADHQHGPSVSFCQESSPGRALRLVTFESDVFARVDSGQFLQVPTARAVGEDSRRVIMRQS